MFLYDINNLTPITQDNIVQSLITETSTQKKTQIETIKARDNSDLLEKTRPSFENEIKLSSTKLATNLNGCLSEVQKWY